MPLTTYSANLIAKAIAHGSAYQGPATIYLALVTTTPTASAAGTPVTYTGYARAEVDISAWDDDDAGVLDNNAEIAFPDPTAGSDETATYVEAYDAASGGNRLWFEELVDPVVINGDTPSVAFPAGQLTVSVV
jgi:hypothetical protein